MNTRTYGHVEWHPSVSSRDQDKPRPHWLITCEPHVMTKLKRYFAKVKKSEHGSVHLLDNPENARELLWFCDRYPLAMEPDVEARLRQQAQFHEQRELAVQGILAGEPSKLQFEMALPPREYQRIGADLAVTMGRLLLADDVGIGKAQPLDAQVLTIGGWVPMGELCLGDTLIDPDGGLCRVKGIFPQGERDIYRLTTSDGSSTECCDEHLWLVQTANDRARGSTRVLPLAEFRENLHRVSGKQRISNYFLPIAQPTNYGLQKPLPVDAWLLGLLVGDGNFKHRGVSVSVADPEILGFVKAALPVGIEARHGGKYDYRLSAGRGCGGNANALLEAIRALGLDGVKAWDKFIPADALRASVDDRIALLRGLMDADGCAEKTASTFSTVSPRLAHDMRELVGSLGGFATLKTYSKSYTYRGEKRLGRLAHVLFIQTPFCPFRCARKAERWRQPLMARSIRSVEHVGRKPVQCIKVSSKRSLYITDGYIVTHNTVSAITALAHPGRLPALVVTMTHLPRQWAKEFQRFAPSLRVHILKSGKPYDLGWEIAPPDIIISNYHKLSGWAETLAPLMQSIVLDEVQELRHEGTGKHEAAAHIAQFCSLKMGLSATPIHNYGGEFYSVMSVLDEDALGTQDEFYREWCSGSGPKATIKDPRAFGQYLLDQGLMLRRTRADVGRELPALTVVPHEVEADRRVLEQLGDDVSDLARLILTSDKLEKGAKFRAAGDLDFRLREATGLAKAPFVAEFVKLLVENGEKVVLYGWHHKCFGRDTMVLMFDGTSKAVQDIVAGDIVMGPDSKPRNVLSTMSGTAPLYEVIPTKGAPFVCSGKHLLALHTGSKNRIPWRTLEAEKFAALSDRSKREFQMERAPFVEFENANPVMEPWLLGYWLGDGASRLNDLRISTADHEVVNECGKIAERHGLKVKSYRCSSSEKCRFYVLGGAGGYRANPLLQNLRNLGLHRNKHIPHCYKTASLNDRRDLLAGLIDSDGSVHKGNAAGSAYFSNANKRLIDDVAWLCRSIGLAAYVSIAKPSSSGFATSNGTHYLVFISGDLTKIPMRIARKQAPPRTNRKNVLRVGLDVRPSAVGQYFGFETDGDHLFLLDDFTIVHNCYDVWRVLLKEYKPAFYTGLQTPNQKDLEIARFMAGDTPIAILSLRSGAGLDGLQHHCRNVVFGELDWSPAVHEQAIGRVYRDGQVDPVCAYFLTSDSGSDPIVSDVLGVKRMQMEGIRDPKAPLVEAGIDPDHMRKLAEDFLRRRGQLTAELAAPPPKHGPGRLPYRTAADIIDWSIPCRSIFPEVSGRRPLATATLLRIARGVVKYVLQSGSPFIVPVTHTTGGNRAHSIDVPLRTVTTAKGGELALATPFFVPRYGERPGQDPRCQPADRPLSTVVTTANGAQLVAAFLAQHNGGMVGHRADAPVSTLTEKGSQQQLVAANLLKMRHYSDGQSIEEPMHTVAAGGQHFGLVAAFLQAYYSTDQDPRIERPLPTVTTVDRFSVVTVTIEGTEYALVDIGMRMLTPRELFRAQGFPEDYVIDPVGPNGKPLTKTAQIRMCGNSVCPPVAEALVRANVTLQELEAPGEVAVGGLFA